MANMNLRCFIHGLLCGCYERYKSAHLCFTPPQDSLIGDEKQIQVIIAYQIRS